MMTLHHRTITATAHRPKRRLTGWRLAAGCMALVLLCGGRVAWADPLAIWFDPLTHNIKPDGKGLEYKEHDFPALVKSDAEWREANAHIALLQIQNNVVRTYPDLKELVNFVNKNHWKFALGAGVDYGAGSERCSVKLEGITSDQDYAHEAVHNITMWHDAGGRLDYISLDSPLLFAHYVSPKCHYEIEEIATRVANTLGHIFKLYPNLKVIDAEAPFFNSNDVWIADMKTWFAAFRQKTGHAIDAVSLDLHFEGMRTGSTWQDTTRQAAAAFRAVGVSTGLLIKHEIPPHRTMTNEQWMELNRQHMRDAIAGRLGIDYFQIAQWHRHVEKNLPESDPMAYTSLVNYASKLIASGRP